MDILGYTVEVTNTWGFLSFLSLFILLLLYFLKPKPFKKIIPSLIFVESKKKKQHFTSFFNKFVKDWLFIIQLIIIILLCLATLKLFTYLNITVRSHEVVCVIDASASSQVKEATGTRFKNSVNICKDNLGVRNSIILIKDTPHLVSKQTNNLNAKRILNSLKPSDSGSNIWDSMIMAADIASSSQAKVLVISDFVDMENKDLLIARDILSSKGFDVVLVNTASQKSNIGIINYKRVDDLKIQVDIKNFNNNEEKVKFKNLNQEITIAPNAIESVELSVKEGVNKIQLDVEDDFETDNLLYVNIPENQETRVLIITNKKGTYVQNALNSIKKLDISIAEPPIVPKIDHDIVVFDNVNSRSIITGLMSQLKEKVSQGDSLIIIAQDDLFKIDFEGLLPVELNKIEESSVPLVNTEKLEQAKDINFGQSQKYFDAKIINNNSLVVVETVADIPVITLTKLGQGNVLYYGIFDEFNSFKLSTDYPVFWYELIKRLSKQNTFAEINRKIGDIIYAEDQVIINPEGEKFQNYVKADKIGIYRIDSKQITVNLLNSRESQISQNKEKQNIFMENLQKQKSLERVSLLPALVALIIVFMLLEVLYIKKRGDL